MSIKSKPKAPTPIPNRGTTDTTKQELELYRQKINKLMENPEMAKKAALLISLLLEQSPLQKK